MIRYNPPTYNERGIFWPLTITIYLLLAQVPAESELAGWHLSLEQKLLLLKISSWAGHASTLAAYRKNSFPTHLTLVKNSDIPMASAGAT